MTSHATAVDLGVQGVRSTIRSKQGKPFRKLPRLLGSHELSPYWVFRKVNLSVDPGDCVVVIADDPLMSTTFMRSLCGLLPADEGLVRSDCRSLMVSPVPNRLLRGLSVRQAIFMLGGLFGMSDQEIDERTDEVVRIAQVRRVLNNRIEESPRHLRHQIAFSLAMVAPVDIVAFSRNPIVGGPQFQPTCAGHLARQKQQGRGLLISTSNSNLVRSLCTKAILLDEEESTTISVDEALKALERGARARNRRRRRLRRERRASFEGEE